MVAAVWMSVWVCSMSTVSQGIPVRARNREATTLPSESQVPTCGLPACRALFTGFDFIATPRLDRCQGKGPSVPCRPRRRQGLVTRRRTSLSSGPRPPRHPRPRSMRITLVTETYFPQVNGVSRTLGQLARHMVEAGDTLQLIHPNYGETPQARTTSTSGPRSCRSTRKWSSPLPPSAGSIGRSTASGPTSSTSRPRRPSASAPCVTSCVARSRSSRASTPISTSTPGITASDS